jgi:cell division septal protein FtsQ
VSVVDTRPQQQRAKGRWIFPAIVAAAAFLMLLSPLWAPLVLRRMAFFRVRHVEIVGTRYVELRDILDRLKVDTLASVWDPTGPLESRVAGHPLVREVTVSRKLPGTLVVRLIEHLPVALVSTADGFRAYDERGMALPIDLTTADVDAPILARPDTAVLRLLGAARTQAPELYRRLSEVRRDGTQGLGASGLPRDEGRGGGDLLLVLDSIPVRTLADVTLHRLADFELVEQDLARRKLRAAEVDLRYRDQVIVRLQ